MFGSQQWGYSSGGYEIEQSLRFEDDNSGYLDWEPETAGNRRTWTYSWWFKPTLDSGVNARSFFSSNYSYQTIDWNDNGNGRIRLFLYEPTPGYVLDWSPQLRDPSAWYHCVIKYDTTQATASDRVKLYINGELITSLEDNRYPPQDWEGGFNNTILHGIGRRVYDSSSKWDGYLADVHFIDGQALDASYFGETDNTYGHWKPIEYAGTYGTNGFYLPFKQDYSVEGMSTTLYSGDGTSNFSVPGVGFQPDLVWIKSRSSALFHSLCDSVRGTNTVLYSNSTSAEKTDGYNGWINSFNTDGFSVGVSASNGTNQDTKSYVAWAWDMGGDSYGVPLTPNAVTDVEHDTAQSKIGGSSILFNGSSSELSFPDDDKWYFRSNNFTIEFWVRFNSTSGVQDFLGQQADTANRWHLTWHGTNGRLQLNNDQGSNYIDYYRTWTPSADTWYHIAVCRIGSQANIGDVVWFIDGVKYPSSSIATGGTPPTSFYSASEVLKIGASSVYGNRFNGWLDEIRISNGARYQSDFTPSTTPFSNDANTILLVHSDTTDGSTTFTDSSGADVNTDGSITSYVAANPTYGQSIVTHTGTGSNETVGHGLSSAPELIITKSRNVTGNWIVMYDVVDGSMDYMTLETTNAAATINYDNPTSSVFTYNDNSGNKQVSYCFHSVTGYSKIGSYTGNGGGSDNVISGLGFRPGWLLIKNASNSGGWRIMDIVRQGTNRAEQDRVMYANLVDVEYKQTDMEWDDDGFTLNSAETDTDVNTNGDTYIYMAFADKREYGFWQDQSGNNNDWVSSDRINESDVSVDSPTNNFATLNPLSRNTTYVGTLYEGNLRQTNGGGSLATMSMPSGKWYWEAYCEAGTNWINLGILDDAESNTGSVPAAANPTHGVNWNSNSGVINKDGTSVDTFSTWTTGDILGLAYDQSTLTITFYKNGVEEGSITASTPLGAYTHMMANPNGTGYMRVNFGQDSSFAGSVTAQGNQDDNGIGDFYYTPPSGYLALCSSNMPDPTVVPDQHFNTVLYTGNGSSQSITGVGFQPDFLWLKNREAAQSFRMFDSVRGAGYFLESDLANAETDDTAYMNAFDSDGWSFLQSAATYNSSGVGYVAWNWKANGSTVSNSDGTTTSTVSVNTDAGFSIVSYTGQSGAQTVGHGLSQAPDVIIVKNRDASAQEWVVYHHKNTTAPETDYLRLDASNATADYGFWNDTAPTSSVFSVGDLQPVNSGHGNDYIAYCWHEVDGYSKFGTYTGNEVTNGSFVYTGFKPAFIILKRTDEAHGWRMFDSKRNDYNTQGNYVTADTNGAEGDTLLVDFLSNGIKIRTNNDGINGTGSPHVYMAFAETPFKYANAR